MQESAAESSVKLIVEHLKSNPLVKVTGDTLDVYVKTSNMTSQKRNRDFHLFTSNIIFSRVASTDMNNDPPKTDVPSLSADDILLGSHDFPKERLLSAYRIILARSMCNLPPFMSLKKLLPKHIPHEFSKKMEQKSNVFPLVIQFKNEAKHEDCLAIMDAYEEQLSKLYTRSFGNLDFLRKFKVPIGGDQLTRVRLQEAKNLRTLSVSPEKRLVDLHPVVCEMWHSKQDFLEKCFMTFYKEGNSTGTLHFFKVILHRSNVNGKVKGRFQPHLDLILAVGEGLVTEQFQEFFQMNSKESEPQHPMLINIEQKSADEQKHCFSV